ncbi:hypothetical protein O2W18_10545 [Modestobacter sp. VKM Ac-2983]|uniref:hypothetical protein n=1 Tax=Modestobacter sp. VKM Ac-2983 TaxID=3004137 RepID=UPI0022AB8484|nr:hypothetical protein [Modestobacter sp. VKM Ac-2983]MCZ2805543.1 hypothetical protein [Modestobacter sp. VKM Ac-2983]
MRRFRQGPREFPEDRLGNLTGEEQRQLSVLLAKVLAPDPGAAGGGASTAPDTERPS